MCIRDRIIDIELKGLYDRIKSIGYKLVIEDKAKEFIASKGYDIQSVSYTHLYSSYSKLCKDLATINLVDRVLKLWLFHRMV